MANRPAEKTAAIATVAPFDQVRPGAF